MLRLASTALLFVFLCLFLNGHFFYPNAFNISHSYNLHRSELLAFLACVLLTLIVNRQLREISWQRAASLQPRHPVAYCLSGVASLFILFNLNEFALYQVTTFVAIIVGAASLSTLSSKALATAIAASFALYSVLALAQLSAYSLSGIRPGHSDIAYGFANYRFFNHMQTVFLPIVIGLALSKSHQRSLQLIILGSAALSAGMLFLTAGRGTTVALLTSALVLAVFNHRKSKQYAIALVVCLVVGMGIAAAINSGWANHDQGFQIGIGKDLTRSSSSGRTTLWSDAIGKIADSPLTGVGAGAYQSSDMPVAHPHNELLTVTLEYGIPVGLCALGLALFWLFCLLRRLSSEKTSALEQGALVGLISAFVHSLFSGIFMTPSGQLAVMLCLAIVIRGATKKENAAPPQSTKFVLIRLTFTALLLLAISAQFVYGTFDMLSPYCESIPKVGPRIWLNLDSPCFPELD